MKRVLKPLHNAYKFIKNTPEVVRSLRILQTTKQPIKYVRNVCLSLRTSRKEIRKINYPRNVFNKRQKTKLLKEAGSMVVAVSTISCLTAGMVYYLGNTELEVEHKSSGKPLIIQYFIRTFKELKYYQKILKAPAKEKLLPDPLEHPYVQPKYTLVVELMDVLVHPEWTYTTGWRYKRRPLLNYFLDTLHGKYEIVIYTAEQGIVVFPLVESIDPKNIIAHKLVRDAVHFTGSSKVKALDKLNRDLSKVVCIDWNAKNVKFNPDNLLNVKRWTGNDNDTSLLDLASFLVTIVASDVEDVREVLKYYSQFNDPVEAYRERQQRFIDQLEEEACAEKMRH